jgi:hypothetical protein
MKVKQAVEMAVRWSRGDEQRAHEIFEQQTALDPALNEQFTREAQIAFIEKLIDGFLAQGYSVDRPDELIEASTWGVENNPLNHCHDLRRSPGQGG